MRVALVSSSIPRKCGIATYARDLGDEMEKQGHSVVAVAMRSNGPENYPERVKYVIRQEEEKEYKKTAELLNDTNIDIVHLQHEYGLFGGEDGEYILEFVRALKKPFVVTFHTVLVEPDGKKKYILQELARLSQSIVVMESLAQDRLVNIYGVNPHDIHVIFHGVPEVAKLTKEEAKKKLGYENRFLLLSNNLISSNKGFEYAIEAVAQIKKSIPEVLFLIIGETHPLVKKYEGEKYRQFLESLVKKYDLLENVFFVDEYISLDQLRNYLASADICITPYLDAQQITSGTLSYAIGVGKACISTPYIYAEHILNKGRGVLVPFRDHQAIAKEVIGLYKYPKKREEIEKKALRYGREMRWSRVVQKHVDMYKAILISAIQLEKKVKHFILRSPDTRHLLSFTDHVGIFQHGLFNIPDPRFGYCTDDNGRALIVASDMYMSAKSTENHGLLQKYIKFLFAAQDKEGRFHTFMDIQQQWLDTPAAVTDAYGRAMWGMGYYLSVCSTLPEAGAVDIMFRKGMTQIPSIRYIHIAAYTILGLYYYIKVFDGKKDIADVAKAHLISLAVMLVHKYHEARSDDWEWFEDSMRYDIFRLPQALFAAYLITDNKLYRDVALKTMKFAEKVNYDSEKGYFDFVGSNGWYPKGGEKAHYDQQPLEPAAASDCYVFAYLATKQRKYLDKSLIAFEWYFGKNRNHTVMIDKKTGGIFDGLLTTGINQNEGAENIVCFLISHFLLQKYLKE